VFQPLSVADFPVLPASDAKEVSAPPSTDAVQLHARSYWLSKEAGTVWRSTRRSG